MSDIPGSADPQPAIGAEEVSYAMPTVEELAALLPQYEILQIIGQGGMGVVYLGRQPALDRLVAIKLMPALGTGYEDFAAKFVTEARAMAKLTHPHIVSVFDFGHTAEGHLYFVMEYVEGSSIHQLIRDRKLTEERIKSLTIQLCDALQYAHDHGVAHRDIKPANLLVTHDWQIKVADFGLAKQLRGASTVDENEYGTPDYSAPERFITGAATDHRADIYAVGVVLYEMLTGTTPAAAHEAISKPVLHPMYASVVSRCLLPDPSQRFQNARDIKTLLTTTVNMPTPSVSSFRPPVRAATSAPPPPKSKSNPVGTITAVFLALLLGGGAIFWLKNPGGEAESVPPENPKHEAITVATPSVPPPVPPSNPPPSPTELLRTPLAAWQIPDGPAGEVGQLVGHTGQISSLQILPDQRRVISISSDSTMRLWDVQEKKELQQITSDLENVVRTAISPDGSQLAMVSSQGSIQVVALTPGAIESKSLPLADPVPVTGAYFSPDGHQLILTSMRPGAAMLIWTVGAQDQQPQVMEGWEFGVMRFEFMPGSDDEFLTLGLKIRRQGEPTGPLIREICIGSLSQKRSIAHLAPDAFPATTMSFSKDGGLLAIGNPSLFLIDAATGVPVEELQGIMGYATGIFLDGDRLLLTHGFDPTVRIWDLNTAEPVMELNADGHCFTQFVVSANQKWAVSGGFYNTSKQGDPRDTDPAHFPIRIWRLPDLSKLGSENGRAKLASRLAKSLEETDPEVAQLRAAALAEIPVPDAAMMRAQLDALNTKYSAALDRTLAGANPQDQQDLMAEKNRLTINAPLPVDDNDVGPATQRFRQIYRQQLQQLEGLRNTAAGECAILFRTKAAPLRQRRRGANDGVGTMRILTTELRLGRALSLAEALTDESAKDPARGIRSLLK
jgi:serine/threonine protein kinase